MYEDEVLMNIALLLISDYFSEGIFLAMVIK